MTGFNAYRLDVTTLSPVHIGTGDSYDPTNYVIDEGALYHVDPGAVAAMLDEHDRERLLGLVSGDRGDVMLRGVQQFFYQRRELLKRRASVRMPVVRGVEQHYMDRMGNATRQNQSQDSVINKFAVHRTARDRDRGLSVPLLLGSSLKGAVRTAVLDMFNKQESAPEPKGLSSFQARVLEYATPEGRVVLDRDPFRLVQISDARWVADDSLPPSEVLFAVNRKRFPERDRGGSLRPSRADRLYQTLECVTACRFRAFEASLMVQDVGHITAPDRLPAARRRLNPMSLIEACNQFYLPLLRSELEKLSARGFVDSHWREVVSNLLDGPVGAAISEKRAFLLRVGRHCGADSVTLNGIRSIRSHRGKENPPQEVEEPLTWWLAATDSGQYAGMLPFGWLIVEVAHIDARPTDWPELRDGLAPLLERLEVWAEKFRKEKEAERAQQAALAEREAELLAAAAAAAARDRMEVERREAEARARSARQAAFDALSESAKLLQLAEDAVERLRANLGSAPQSTTDECNRLVNRLLDEAPAWSSAAERERAAQVAENTYDLLGWHQSGIKPEKRRKQEQKKRDAIARLRAR